MIFYLNLRFFSSYIILETVGSIFYKRRLREMNKLKWHEECDNFQKLLVLRCLRSDKVTNAMQDFVAENLGQRFIEPQVRLNLV